MTSAQSGSREIEPDAELGRTATLTRLGTSSGADSLPPIELPTGCGSARPEGLAVEFSSSGTIRVVVLLTLLALSISGVASPIKAQSKELRAVSESRSKIRRQYRVQRSAFAQKDVRAYMSTLTSGYKALHRENGDKLDLDRASVEQSLGQTFRSVISQHRVTQIIKWEVGSDHAAVDVINHLWARTRNPIDKSIYLLTSMVSGEDTWVRSGTTWKLSQSIMNKAINSTKLLKKGENDSKEKQLIRPKRNG